MFAFRWPTQALLPVALIALTVAFPAALAAQKTVRGLPGDGRQMNHAALISNQHAQSKQVEKNDGEGPPKRVASLPEVFSSVPSFNKTNLPDGRASSTSGGQERSTTGANQQEDFPELSPPAAPKTDEDEPVPSPPVGDQPATEVIPAPPQLVIEQPSFQNALEGLPGSRATGTFGNTEVVPAWQHPSSVAPSSASPSSMNSSSMSSFHANGFLPYDAAVNHGPPRVQQAATGTGRYPLYASGQPESGSYPPGAGASFGAPVRDRRYQQQQRSDYFKSQTETTLERQRFWDQFPSTPPEDSPQARTEGYTSFGAVLANGYAYGRIEFAILEAHFENNGGLNLTAGPLTSNEPWDFGYELTPRFVFGFESNGGPGIELNHWQFNEFSDGLNFLSNGVGVGEVTVFAGGSNGTRSLAANAAGQLLQSRHHLKIQSTTASVFKAVDAPVSRIRGLLGLRYVASQHDLLANRSDGASLFNNSNFQGGGPTFGIDYLRPIGHTQFNLLGGLNFSLLFGHHDQSIFESGTLTFRETATDHHLAIIDLHMGAEWRRKIARCNSLLIRGTFESQHWINGGSAVDPDSDFGLYGFVLSAGLTR